MARRAGPLPHGGPAWQLIEMIRTRRLTEVAAVSTATPSTMRIENMVNKTDMRIYQDFHPEDSCALAQPLVSRLPRFAGRKPSVDCRLRPLVHRVWPSGLDHIHSG